MNAQPLDDHQDPDHVEHSEDVGRRLRAARVDRGLDLDRIAAQLHLKPSLIEALEAGRYEALPGSVFVTGYIRNYARQVGLDPEPLIAAYLSLERRAEPLRVRSQPRATGSDLGGSGFLLRLMTVVLVAGVAYLFVQWWQNRSPRVSELAWETASVLDSKGPSAAPDRVAPEVTNPPVTPVEGPSPSGRATAERSDVAPPHRVPATVAAAPMAETPMPSAAPEAPQDAPQDAPRADPDPSPALGLEPAGVAESAAPEAAQDSRDPVGAEQDDVILDFRGPCWVDVRDSAKSFSLTGEMTTGDRRILGGTPPYSLILGNASAVTVTVKGAPFDLTRVTKGNVARFKLDPAALP